jgi:hypothetical protein
MSTVGEVLPGLWRFEARHRAAIDSPGYAR